MRVAFLVLGLCACQKERIEAEHVAASASVVVATASAAPPAAPSVTVSATASASSAAPVRAPAARIPCGTTTCASMQYCLHVSKGQGIVPPPGQNPVTSMGFECADSIPHGSLACGAVMKDRQVSCQALIPAAPPR